MMWRKCAVCNTKVGGLSGRKNYGTGKRALCEACTLKQIRDKLQAAKKRPIRTRHAETLYEEFSDFFSTSDERDIATVPANTSAKNPVPKKEKRTLPAIHHKPEEKPEHAFEKKYRLSEKTRDEVKHISNSTGSSHWDTGNPGIIDAVIFSDDGRVVPDSNNEYKHSTIDQKTLETKLLIADIFKAPSTAKEKIKFPKKITESVTDVDGNRYTTVTIGKQVWTVENLKTTKFNDGARIPLVDDASEWPNLTTPGYCFFKNELYNREKFGALYNWFAVNSGKIAPQGWHVPNTTEWNILVRYLSTHGYNWEGSLKKDEIAKSLAAETCWNLTRESGTIGNDLHRNNRSGFSALPAGFRNHLGDFSGSGNTGSWWSTTKDVAFYAYSRYLSSGCSNLTWDYHNMRFGFSVRLVKD